MPFISRKWAHLSRGASPDILSQTHVDIVHERPEFGHFVACFSGRRFRVFQVPSDSPLRATNLSGNINNIRTLLAHLLYHVKVLMSMGSADEFLDLQGLIYAFIRGPDPGRRTLLPVRKESLRCRHGAGISFHKTAGPLGSDL